MTTLLKLALFVAFVALFVAPATAQFAYGGFGGPFGYFGPGRFFYHPRLFGGGYRGFGFGRPYGFYG